MIKRRKVKSMYIVQVVCEECGKPMRCSYALCSCPAQYCYECANCGATLRSTTKDGSIEYEFEDEENV